MTNNKLMKMVIAALMIALGLVLPLFLGGVEVLGQSISPMHIPALICGLTCGPLFGAVAGFIMPLLRSAIFGMPPFPVVSLPMAFELAAYGALAGLLYPLCVKMLKLQNRIPAMYAALVAAMVGGRLVGGAAKAIVMGAQGKGYTFEAFIGAYFVATAVGAVIHLIIVPAITVALEKAKLSPLAKEKFSNTMKAE